MKKLLTFIAITLISLSVQAGESYKVDTIAVNILFINPDKSVKVIDGFAVVIAKYAADGKTFADVKQTIYDTGYRKIEKKDYYSVTGKDEK